MPADFFANSFTISRLTRTYFNEDAGLSHVHGGPQDSCPNLKGAKFTTCNADFRTQPPERFSAYRFFDKDPLVFDDRLEMSVRYLPPGKCSLRTSVPTARDEVGHDNNIPGAEVHSLTEESTQIETDRVPWRTRFDAYTWFYTFERDVTP